jgi:mannan endo-1,4-beta-mannosidase
MGGRVVARVVLVVALAGGAASAGESPSAFERFVTTRDGRLFDGDREMRFISFNIPNLNYVEDDFAFDRPHPYRLPDEYEIRDALESVRQMGGQVVRMYTIPVRRRQDPEDVPTFLLAPGRLDEDSMQAMDRVLALANEVGVRLIVPLLNNWPWMGGVPQYADFRGREESEFWTDRQLIEDFKRTVELVLTRTNTLTGVDYRDDRAILCWETGNELAAPWAWTHEIAGHIKSLDPNHLLMDGYYAIDPIPVREEAVDDPLVDIVSSHHYAPDPDLLRSFIRTNLEMVGGRKPYVVGEFGFLGTQAVERVLDELIQSDVSGALIWSLRSHRREGGFYWHTEPMGSGLFKAYHWPGFASGADYDERRLLSAMRERAFAVQGRPAPPLEPPAAPRLLPIDHPSRISWRGSAGASAYVVERSPDGSDTWVALADDVSDAADPYEALFRDLSAVVGESYRYRVRARNVAGVSPPSNEVGPVAVDHATMVDTMRGRAIPYAARGDVRWVTGDARRFRERLHRRRAPSGSELVYALPGRITGVRVQAFAQETHDPIVVLGSPDGRSYGPLAVERRSFALGDADYGYWIPVLYSGEGRENDRYIKIVFRVPAELSRVEIDHVPPARDTVQAPAARSHSLERR